ncbi:SAXO1 protein, partial [Turnix velox]|nr:SAXO1 protein [Turnix velox]
RCHRCPHLPTRPYEKSGEPCMLSEYREQYLAQSNSPPRDSFKPKEMYKMAEIPMEGISTTKRDYTAPEVLPERIKLLQKPIKTDDSMDLTSTYSQDYKSHPLSQVSPCLPRVLRHIPTTKMDTGTTYNDDYVLWNEPKTEMIRPDDRFRSSEEKFDSTTVVQDDYLYRGPVATQSCKPLNLVQKSKVPFENITSYKMNYVPHTLEKPYVHKYKTYKVNEVPFDGLTTHKICYKGLAGQPAKLAKPHQPKLHNLPFSSSTEFREKYQAWPQPPLFIRRPDVYLPPLEKMDLHTTTKIDYKRPNGKPAKMCRSLIHFKKNTEPFNSTSIMKEDYKPWMCERLKPIIHVPELTFPEQGMDCLTTFQSCYVRHPLIVTKSCKPGWSGPKHDTAIDDKTTYATSYTPKVIDKCLGSYKDPPGYSFEGNDADGHRLFLPTSESECLQGDH